MSGINGVGNLQKDGVRPLRNTPRMQAGNSQAGQTFSVEDLKKGGTINLAPEAAKQAENASAEKSLESGAQRTIQERYRGRKTVKTSRRSQNSQLPVEDQLKKLGQIQKSAVEYEAFFVDHLVKQMRQSPLAKTPGGDTFSDIAEQPFRDFLSQAGGLGLAGTITGQLARQEGLEQTLQDYPEVMGPKWRNSTPANLMKKPAGGLEIAPPSMPEKEKGPEIQAGSAGPDQTSAGGSNPEKAAGVGLMNSEEISWLYGDASEAMA
ncbi:hypothetical protein LJB86_04175 [Deltaproteobacteria bacterium OttesenSCG-928-M10]|nr:hypothetical protein [Deltaproteobacteria bacterium OttesenSCG-928-M10]